ncbi:MAG: hypothetical protein M1495_21390 [Bacteroidetes bacterium]|nr:hypothetical protein [Bacteroidota bacterium]
MKTLNRILFLAVVSIFCAASLTYAQDSTKSKSGEHEKEMKKEMPAPSGKMDKKSGMYHGMMMHMKGMKGMKHESSAELDSSVIRKGEIDLTAIDENKDGRVFQCQMDFNVLSDKPGVDPKCGMKLEEVSIEKAKENLLKHGYKIKDLPEQK